MRVHSWECAGRHRNAQILILDRPVTAGADEEQARRAVRNRHRDCVARQAVALHLNHGRPARNLIRHLERQLAIRGVDLQQGFHSPECSRRRSKSRAAAPADRQRIERKLLTRHHHHVAARHRIARAEGAVIHHALLMITGAAFGATVKSIGTMIVPFTAFAVIATLHRCRPGGRAPASKVNTAALPDTAALTPVRPLIDALWR